MVAFELQDRRTRRVSVRAIDASCVVSQAVQQRLRTHDAVSVVVVNDVDRQCAICRSAGSWCRRPVLAFPANGLLGLLDDVVDDRFRVDALFLQERMGRRHTRRKQTATTTRCAQGRSDSSKCFADRGVRCSMA
ncbi:MAG TPA: hypothetical protein VM491_10905 [Burkholderiaceae bacterium]|nr:hypothetical protein [Burkholderiaceae bacterium]